MLLVTTLVLAGCSTAADPATTTIPPATASTTATATAETAPPPPTSTSTLAPTTTQSPFAPPNWLGTRVLPLGPDGENALAQPTPPELLDRQIATVDDLPPPIDDTFTATIGPVPDDVLARSTWTPDCPVGVDELAYVTVTHVGFDGEFHTGELIVNASVADDIVQVFEQLHAVRFPIEQMRIITPQDLEEPPTGDGNETTSFVCRPAVGSGKWSQHAYGLAIDINPFHNPYLKGDLVLPELATAYTDRDRVLPGMILDGDAAVDAFAAIGWAWGGDWNTLKDWMHFSQNGR